MITRKLTIDFGNVFTKVVQGGLFYSSTKTDFNSLREKFFLRNEHGVRRIERTMLVKHKGDHRKFVNFSH